MPSRRRGFACRAGTALALLAILGLLPPVAPATTTELAALRAAGTPRLALDVIDAEQPAASTDRAGWLAWESARLDLLRELGDWAAIEARVTDHPPGLPRDFTDRSRTLQAEAALARGDGATARARLRALVWQREGHAAGLQGWREQLIRGYLLDGLTEEAHLAMLRYRQDYGNADPALRELGVRILLRAGRPAAALAALGNAADPTADALRLLAELRAGTVPADAVGTAAAAQARALGDDPAGAARYWAVAVEAATLAEQTAARVTALEAGLPATDLPPAEAPFALVPGDLWRAYRVHGEALGNRAQLLVGQDAAWFELAATRATDEPLAARALFATLAQLARDPEVRAASHAAFATSVAATPRGMLLLKRLYLDGVAGLDVDALPVTLRQRLADEALVSGDPATAVRLYAALDTPPDGVDAFAWQLHRGRQLVRAGEPTLGGAALLQLVQSKPERAAAELDALLPTILDVQQGGAHAAASALLEALLAGPLDDPGQHRALLLALAGSQQASGVPLRAARLYLRGALLPGTDASDPAARRARHAAVGALVDAGLRDDAIALLAGLLADTPERARAPLEEELRRLRKGR